MELVEALGLQPAQPSGPYVPREKELVEYAKGLKSFPTPDQLTVDEAASIFDVWQSAKALHVCECASCIGDGLTPTHSCSSRRRDVLVEIDGVGRERQGVREKVPAADYRYVACCRLARSAYLLHVRPNNIIH